MKKSYVMGLVLVLCLVLVLPVSAGDLRYDFDEVEVLLGAAFSAIPTSVPVANWSTDIAGGPHEPLEVLYGVVNLKTTGSGDTGEEFIKVSGPNGTERFLANSMTTRWYGDEGQYEKLRSNKTLFWSAKKLENNTVIKDFTGPIKSVILQKEFDEDQNLTSIKLFFSDEGKKAAQEFWIWEAKSLDSVYECDMATLQTVGDPMVSIE